MARTVIIFGFLIALLFLLNKNYAAYIKLTNAVCENLNKSWIRIDTCRLKVIRRDMVVFNMSIDVLSPANNIYFRLEMKKKANGYKPFLMNYTVDACKFLRKPNQPAAIFIWSLFKNFSNINHTCPYSGTQLVRNLYIAPEKVTLPFPTGDYGLYLTWIFEMQPQFTTNVFFSFVEDF